MYMKMIKVYLLLFGIGIFAVFTFIYFKSNQLPLPLVAPSTTVSCTLDTKICPDGTAVGRVPPSCTFAPCAYGSDSESI